MYAMPAGELLLKRLNSVCRLRYSGALVLTLRCCQGDRDGGKDFGGKEGNFLSCRTAEYLYRPFPSHEAAGIVKRPKDGGPRRVLPLCFFHVPMPEQRCIAALRPDGSDSASRPRGVVLPDLLRGCAYVTYLPQSTAPGQRLILRRDRAQ